MGPATTLPICKNNKARVIKKFLIVHSSIVESYL
jgi:hypothetical protein